MHLSYNKKSQQTTVETGEQECVGGFCGVYLEVKLTTLPAHLDTPTYGELLSLPKVWRRAGIDSRSFFDLPASFRLCPFCLSYSVTKASGRI